MRPHPSSIPALRLVVAGGGTGGHLFPGIAVAQELSRREPDAGLLFIGTDRPFEREAVGRAGYRHRAIRIEGIKGRGIVGTLRALAKLPGALFASVRMLRSFAPDLVLGVGGYSSGPVVLAARLLGIPSALHEQNLLPGITNRILGRLVDRIYVSFAGTGRLDPKNVFLRAIRSAGNSPGPRRRPDRPPTSPCW